MNETEWQGQVLDLARLYGWLVAHFRPARTERGWRTAVSADGAGFPDLVLVRGDELLYRELKAERGRLSELQKMWLDALAAAGADVGVWRPSDFELVHERLRR